MPSSITHQLIAEEAKDRLPAPLAAAISAAPEAFFLGAQGPDPFFFVTTAKNGQNIGKYLHRNRIYGLFCAFSEYLKNLPEEKRTAAEAYCLGYVTHYCADVTFHPFVYRYLEQNKLKKREHQRIENDWDVYFLRKLRGREAERYAFPDLATLGEQLNPLWTYAAAAMGKKLPAGTLKAAIAGFEKYLHFFHKNCYAAQRRWARFDKLFHIRSLSCMYPARTPDEKILRGEAFERAAHTAGMPPAKHADDLFERAVSMSAYRMLLFYDALGGASLPREEFDRHLLTGEHTEEPPEQK